MQFLRSGGDGGRGATRPLQRAPSGFAVLGEGRTPTAAPPTERRRSRNFSHLTRTNVRVIIQITVYELMSLHFWD